MQYALESLKQQQVDFRAVVADNCSKDGSYEIATDTIGADPRFELYRHPENVGGYYNAHDYISEGYLDRVLTPTRERTEISMFIGLPHSVDEHERPLGVRRTSVYGFSESSGWLRYFQSMAQLNDCTIVQSATRRRNLTGFEWRRTISCDHVFLSHHLRLGTVLYLPDVTYFRREFLPPRETTYSERIVGTLSGGPLPRSDSVAYYLDDFRSKFRGDDGVRLYLEAKLLEILEKRFGLLTVIDAGLPSGVS